MLTDLSREFDLVFAVVGDRVGAGVECADKRPGRVEAEQVEVVLEHPVHEQGVLPLPHCLIHEQLRLLWNV